MIPSVVRLLNHVFISFYCSYSLGCQVFISCLLFSCFVLDLSMKYCGNFWCVVCGCDSDLVIAINEIRPHLCGGS